MFVVLVLVLGADAGVDAGVDGGRSRRRREYRIQQRDPATAPSRRDGRLGHRFIRVCLPHLRRRPKPQIATRPSSSTSVMPLLTPEVASCAGALGRCEPLALAA
ncbi:hypothetical protein DFH08DRAFT_888175 [Mycena albidolilacea]|uniref:Secreted protein n=1 Tax=Mycena albidolilacea TaxID=1033008 RepID=A0AAD7EG92_9AGAR|nr:hypothetical protein DFH08DRAFT_888175 [Mycena albidolilacea]